MNGREKRIHKDHTNERKQAQQREEYRRESEKIQQSIREIKDKLALERDKAKSI